MQRISALWSSRERTKSLTGAHVGVNAGTINTLPHRQRPEDYWPSNLDRESEKAARILQAFCTDSYNARHDGGSTAKRVDVYDCVLVINSASDLEMFTRPTTVLGTDVQLALGPVIADGRLENELRGKDPGHTIMTYVRARGEHRAVDLDGSSVTERGSENERFYGQNVSVLEILAGAVHRNDVPEIKMLYEVLKCAEGLVNFDSALLEHLALQPAPGDAMIDISSSRDSMLSPGKHAFGLPDVEDPDPFGVKALEMAGLEIRESGTRQRPPSSQFEYNPSPTSPFFGRVNRHSTDTYISQSNRGSYMSNRTTLSRMTDAFTQTTTDTRGTTPTSADEGVERSSIPERLPVVIEPEELEASQETVVRDAEEVADKVTMVSKDAATDSATDEIKPPSSPQETVPANTTPQTTRTAPANPQAVAELEASSLPGDDRGADADDEDSDAGIDQEIEEEDQVNEDDDEEEDVEEEEEEEEPVVFEVARASQPPRAAILSSQVAQIIHAKGALVNIPKRVVPAIPPRSPARSSGCSKSEFGDIPARSPLRNSSQSTSTGKSEEDLEQQSPDGVADVPSEVTTNVTPASPLEQNAETSGQVIEERLPIGHRRRSSSVHTADSEHRRFSMEPDDIPKTPSTLHTSGQTSSGDEQEPRTPGRQLGDEVSPVEDEKKVSAVEEVQGFGVDVEAH
ncbi:hypothetical protein SLS53_000843 [Cytospora paraplurivora]|uniref:Ysc84 actin-binding domain-containing protein n=1 Tax=Cytospora paraplurivora TaxID=2898453 RepID=A0AAN9YNI5_9PEZI